MKSRHSVVRGRESSSDGQFFGGPARCSVCDFETEILVSARMHELDSRTFGQKLLDAVPLIAAGVIVVAVLAVIGVMFASWLGWVPVTLAVVAGLVRMLEVATRPTTRVLTRRSAGGGILDRERGDVIARAMPLCEDCGHPRSSHAVYDGSFVGGRRARLLHDTSCRWDGSCGCRRYVQSEPTCTRCGHFRSDHSGFDPVEKALAEAGSRMARSVSIRPARCAFGRRGRWRGCRCRGWPTQDPFSS